MTACANLNPLLPTDNDAQKEIWSNRMWVNLVKDECLSLCAQRCSFLPLDDGCRACLSELACPGDCDECLLAAENPNYDQVSPCVVDSGLSVGAIVGIVIGSVALCVVIAIAVYYGRR